MLRPLTGPVSSRPRRGLHNVKAHGFSRGWRTPVSEPWKGETACPTGELRRIQRESFYYRGGEVHGHFRQTDTNMIGYTIYN